jgi:hypothetical protein
MRHRKLTALCGLALSLAVVSAACGGDDQTAVSELVEEGRDLTESLRELDLGAGVQFTSGSATLQVSGDIEEVIELDGSSSIADKASLALQWLNDEGSSLTIIGSEAFTGVQTTGDSLFLQIVITRPRGETVAFGTTSNECAITIDSVAVAGLGGSLECSGLHGTKGTVDVAAEFSLQP